MSKRVEITPELQAKIRNSAGDPELDTSNFVVFEARMLTSEPLKKGGFWHKARVSASTIKEMEAKMNMAGAAIPLHIMHNDEVLPVGKVFSARAMTLENGETELRGQFYIPKDKTDLIKDIEASVVDEVSVSILTKHAFCSECEFDYLGEDADFSHFLSLTCENGHEIGVDGTHVRLVGLDDWAELSLVGEGASQNAKILPRAKQSMGKEMVDRLAASSKAPLSARVLTASGKIEDSSETVTTKKGDTQMSDAYDTLLSKFESQSEVLATTKVELSQANETIEGLNGKITELETALTTKDKEIEELNAKAENPETDETLKATADEAVKKAEEAEQTLAAAADKLKPHVEAALVADGVKAEDIPTDLTKMVDAIEEKGLKLHQVVGTKATADGTKTDADSVNEQEKHRKDSFKLSSK